MNLVGFGLPPNYLSGLDDKFKNNKLPNCVCVTTVSLCVCLKNFVRGRGRR